MNFTPDPAERFRYVDPPFQFNAPDIARYPPEVTGYRLLQSLCRRLGWASLADHRLLDYGCGVRFARTIWNLGLDVGAYAGVDVNGESIAWLAANADDPRFRFERIDMHQHQYNPGGVVLRNREALREAGLTDFDAACMFSVITHQAPEDARAIFAMLHSGVRPGGQLYFTAFADEAVERYRDGEPARPAHYSIYHPDYLAELAATAGWDVTAVYATSELQQTAFVCRRRDP